MSADLLWTWATIGFVLMVPATLCAGWLDRRSLDGVNVWTKPWKFALAFGIHYATFAVIAYFLSEEERRSAWIVNLARASAAAGALELAYIALQAARGRRSHFNQSTTIEAFAYLLMGVGAFIVIAPAVVLGLFILMFPPVGWPIAVVLGTSTGLIGGTVLTLITATKMGAAQSHFAGGKYHSSRKLPITGWSLDGADLRPAHFLATHMMQAVPIAAVCAAWIFPASVAVGVSVFVAIAWTALTLALFRWTMKGRSLLALVGPGER